MYSRGALFRLFCKQKCVVCKLKYVAEYMLMRKQQLQQGTFLTFVRGGQPGLPLVLFVLRGKSAGEACLPWWCSFADVALCPSPRNQLIITHTVVPTHTRHLLCACNTCFDVKDGEASWSDAEGQLSRMSRMRCPGDMLRCIVK